MRVDVDNAPPKPLPGSDRDNWLIKPGITFLNHGSFGAVPREVFEHQEQWRRRIEAEPVEYLWRRYDENLVDAKAAIGRWLGMRPDDFGLVTNATEGVNAVLRSLELKSGDELLTTTHVYNAVRQAMKYIARQTGASYREIELPLPIESPEEITSRIAEGLSPRTRLLVVDHVTSPTAMVFPIERITAECTQRGIDVLVDGAHAPGMLDLNVEQTGAAYYAGNLHKWACAPKGSAFLWVRPDRHDPIHPSIISHNFEQGLAREFAWQGTRDISAHMSIPAAIEYMGEIGWDRIREHNHGMATWAHRMLCERFDVGPISPLDGRMLGSMATVRLPGRLASLDEQSERPTQRQLYNEYGIEVPLVRWCGEAFLRVSCQVYNRPEDYQRLAEAIVRISR